jgi:O-methyltransferase
MSQRLLALEQENAALRAQLTGVGKERDDLRRDNDALRMALNNQPAELPSYDDGGALKVWGKNIGFVSDPRFISAYKRGENSGHLSWHPDGRPIYDLRWQVAVTCWAATHGVKLPGHFVECGVNTGWHSLAICEYVNFNALDKDFYLFDTFTGLPEDQMSAHERTVHKNTNARFHPPNCYEIVCKNFAPFPRVKLICGKVPETLTSVAIDRVAYLSLDMNLTYPERAALEFFWPRMSTGAVIILDDYGWAGMHEQKDAHDAFAAAKGTEILTLPTGQGLLVKP